MIVLNCHLGRMSNLKLMKAHVIAHTLAVFPNIFKGTIEKSKKMIDVFEGKDITVEFSGPRALQIDGETMLGVTKYHVICDRK